jgi:glycosyltransferase involved in cell wall biosynthesis
MRIAYLAEPESGNGFYRGRGPMTALEQLRGHDVRRLPTEDGPPPLAGVRDVDVLHIHRFADERAQQLVREAKAHGAAVVWDNDDDVAAVPKGSPAYKIFGGVHGERRLTAMKRIFRVADLVTAPSHALVKRLQAAGAAHAAVVENQLPDQFLRVERRPHRGVTIGWIAGLEHQLDVERLPIREALQRLLDERQDVDVVTFGLRLGLRSERYRHVDVVPLFELTQEAAAFDIGIAPLADIELSRSRSNVKLKEYAAAGVPWLASPIGPYAGMGEKQGGRLVADERWHEELSRLLDRPRERRKLAKRAVKWVAGETLTKHVGVWESKLAEAVERARATAAA